MKIANYGPHWGTTLPNYPLTEELKVQVVTTGLPFAMPQLEGK